MNPRPSCRGVAKCCNGSTLLRVAAESRPLRGLQPTPRGRVGAALVQILIVQGRRPGRQGRCRTNAERWRNRQRRLARQPGDHGRLRSSERVLGGSGRAVGESDNVSAPTKLCTTASTTDDRMARPRRDARLRPGNAGVCRRHRRAAGLRPQRASRGTLAGDQKRLRTVPCAQAAAAAGLLRRGREASAARCGHCDYLPADVTWRRT